MNSSKVTTLAALVAASAISTPAFAQERATEWLDVPVGQSFIYQDSRPIARILVSDPEVAELKLLEQGQFQVRGLGVGSTDLWVWFRGDINNPVSYQLTVHEDLSNLIRRVDDLVDGAAPKVYPLRDRLVVEGGVPDVETLEQINNIASIYDEEYINLMSVEGDHQVQLEVIFAEVNRSGMRELGINGIWSDRQYVIGAEGPSTSPSSFIWQDSTAGVNSGYLFAPTAGPFNFSAILPDPLNLALILSIMETHSITKVLARPTLVALSGQQAEFLAGGEVPIPVAQHGQRGSAIEFKEYGVKLVFVPTVLGGEVVDMRVYVEVQRGRLRPTSIRLTGIEIPGFSSSQVVLATCGSRTA